MKNFTASVFAFGMAASALGVTDNSKLGVLDSNENFIVSTKYTGSTGQTVRTVKRSSTGTLAWANDFTVSGLVTDYNVVRIRVDSNDNVYVAGYYRDLASLTSPKFFVLRYGTGGSLLWSQTYDTGLRSASKLTDMALDTNGVSYLVGYNADSTGVASKGKILKYSSSGSLLYDVDVQGTSTDSTYLTSAEIYSTSRLFVGGVCEKYSSTSAPTVYSTYAARYNNTLGQVWESVETILSGGNYVPTKDGDVALDSAGDAFFSNGYSNLGTSTYNVCVRKKAAAGTAVWAQQTSGGNLTGEGGIIVDSADNVLVGGADKQFNGTQRYGWRLVKLSGSTGSQTWNSSFVYTSSFPLPPVKLDNDLTVTCLAQQSDGKYVVCGDLTQATTYHFSRTPIFNTTGTPTGSYYDILAGGTEARVTSFIPTATAGNTYIGGTVGDGTQLFSFQSNTRSPGGWDVTNP